MVGGGYLSATYDLPYQTSVAGDTPGPIQNDATTNIADVENRDGAADDVAIRDDGTKLWRGFTVDVDPDDADNLLGESHVFTITVGEFGPGVAEAADVDAKVYFAWSGPSGSGITHIDAESVGDDPVLSGSCVVNDGTCRVKVNSPVGGSGTLTVTKVEGTIAGEAVTVTTFDTKQDESDTDFHDDVDGDKTWVEFRLWVAPQTDTNYVDWTHDFVIHVQRSDNNGTSWQAVTGATFGTTDYGFGTFTDGLTLADLTVDPSDCVDGTQVDSSIDPNAGTCVIKVDTAATGSTLLTVTGMTVPFDGDDIGTDNDHVTVSGSAALSASGPSGEDNSAEKIWADYGATLDGDVTNLLGDEHDFTVTVTRDPEGDLSQATVTLAWTGPDGSTVTTNSDSATVGADAPDYDSDGDSTDDAVTVTCTPTKQTDDSWTCDVTVDSDSDVGTGTLSVVAISDGAVVDGDENPVTIDDIEFGNATSTATKTWIAVDLDIGDDATNFVGEAHPFDVTARLFDGTEADPQDLPVDGAILCVSLDGDVGGIVSPTPAGNESPCAEGEYEITSTTAGKFVVTVNSSNPGSLTVTLESIHFTYDDGSEEGVDFDVILDDSEPGYQPGEVGQDLGDQEMAQP